MFPRGNGVVTFSSQHTNWLYSSCLAPCWRTRDMLSASGCPCNLQGYFHWHFRRHKGTPHRFHNAASENSPWETELCESVQLPKIAALAVSPPQSPTVISSCIIKLIHSQKCSHCDTKILTLLLLFFHFESNISWFQTNGWWHLFCLVFLWFISYVIRDKN